jgi:threonine dehydratase
MSSSPSRATPPLLEEIRAAAEGLREVIVHTPLVPYRRDPDILLKPEIHQAVGSFKVRGVFHAVSSLSPEERSRGVSTVSAGNTAQALAWSARRFGVEARSIMPETAPRTKIDKVWALGGTPVLVPVEEVFAYLREHRWEDEPYTFVHPWTDRRVMTGHGSLGLEIAADCPDVESVFVSVGGGGLLAGVGSAIKALRPQARIVAVEPAGCPALATSLERGRPAEVPCRTICDGVAVPYITEEMFPLLQDLVDEVILVDDSDTKAAIATLAREHHVIVEGAAAVSFAAALRCPEERRGRSVVVLTGGSIDADLLVEILGDHSGARRHHDA